NKGTKDLCIIGIVCGGCELSKRIAKKIFEVENKEIPVGFLDITNFRDDIKTQKALDKTDIPFDIADKTVILVDDVLFTGRSVRAAIDALMDRGRPQKIQLATLIDRGHRELPIRADFIGKNVPTSKIEVVEVCIKETDGSDSVSIFE
ncbi:MAG: bifunctional pyr operon transcriptional regulator/uracil phosphoribosyltransferase PyrR, partial [Oscillospiraceae bacterium]